MPEPTHTWTCDCGTTVSRYRGQSDVSCPSCGQWFNASGQRLRQDWQNNPSNYDDEIDDLTGYEIAAAQVAEEIDDRLESTQRPAETAWGVDDYESSRKGTMSNNPTSDYAAIKAILNQLERDNWLPWSVDDGEEDTEIKQTGTALTLITAVEDAKYYVKHVLESGEVDATGWVRFVLGNEPFEVAANYTVNLSESIEKLTDTWE